MMEQTPSRCELSWYLVGISLVALSSRFNSSWLQIRFDDGRTQRVDTSDHGTLMVWRAPPSGSGVIPRAPQRNAAAEVGGAHSRTKQRSVGQVGYGTRLGMRKVHVGTQWWFKWHLYSKGLAFLGYGLGLG